MRWFTLMAASALAVVGVAAPAQASPDRGTATSRYIVVLEDSVADSAAVAEQHAQTYGLDVGHVYRHALQGYAATVPEARLDKLRADRDVAFVSPDRKVRATQQELPTGIDRIEGDQSSTVAGDGTGTVDAGVAVIDTGIDMNHPDLNVAGGTNCVLPLLPPDDLHGHGTHVAGTVAAEDNDSGVVGMAPGARLYAVKVLNALGTGSTSNVICGIDWVAANADAEGITVANMSLGGSGTDDENCGNTNDDAMHQAICNAVDEGVTFAVAAGNANSDMEGTVPAAYDEVLTVTAMADFNGEPGGGAEPTCRTDEDDTAAGFSNFTEAGSADADHTIAAPGVCILSTAAGGGTTVLSGTSMASPHMAGTAALCIASGPCADQTPAEVIDTLRGTAAAQPADYGFEGDPHNPADGRYYGHLGYAGDY